MTGLDKIRPIHAIYLLLAMVTFWVYWPVTTHDFVSFDDSEYILENPAVQNGLSPRGFVWAFETEHTGNWHPLTWLSHQLDCTLFGLKPAGPHLVNLLFHIADTLLLFALLCQLTKAKWRSAFVAALFALHPLHVESVAWIAERKDVLSTFFWLLTMLAYARYVKELAVGGWQNSKTKIFYGVAILCFALGLMCKPMLVTLPCVLLLMDFWPLGRIAIFKKASENSQLAWRNLLLEKIPFGLLAVASSVVTYLAQKNGHAVSSLEIISLRSRCANALMSYVVYLWNTIWPLKLAVIYPFVTHWPTGEVVEAVILLFALSGLFLWHARQNPHLLVGWLWFLGTLVPTIGLVQVGLQSHADRYMYIPGIGLFIVLVWGLNDLFRRLPKKEIVLGFLGAIALAGCVIVTRMQLGFWQNSETLFQRAIDVTPDNYLAYNGLGAALLQRGDLIHGVAMLTKCARIEPRFPDGQYNLAVALLDQGRVGEGVEHLNAAIAARPQYALAQSVLGKTLGQQGRLPEALEHLSLAVKSAPDNPTVHFNLGTFLMLQSRFEDAAREFSAALALSPGFADAHANLGVILIGAGRLDEGIAELTEALRLNPDSVMTRLNLGRAWLQKNHPREAAQLFSAAVQLNPQEATAHFYLALSLASQRKSAEAIVQFREGMRLRPDFAESMNGLAWLLGTDPSSELRNGTEAVRLAEHACQLTQYRNAEYVLTLAAADAETGQFSEAIAMAEKARDLATDKSTAAKAAELLQLFQAHHPYRQDL